IDRAWHRLDRGRRVYRSAADTGRRLSVRWALPGRTAAKRLDQPRVSDTLHEWSKRALSGVAAGAIAGLAVTWRVVVAVARSDNRIHDAQYVLLPVRYPLSLCHAADTAALRLRGLCAMQAGATMATASRHGNACRGDCRRRDDRPAALA